MAEHNAALKESKRTDKIKKVFAILDYDESGYIEEEELTYFVQNFDSITRELNAAEVKDFLQVGETDGELKLRAEDLVRK